MRVSNILAGLALSLLSSAAQGVASEAKAFGFCVEQVTIDVAPGVLGTGQRAMLTVYDRTHPFGPFAIATNTVVSVSGSSISVVATIVDPPVGADLRPFTVDLGVFPVGRYTVNYDGGPGPSCPAHEATTEFIVTEGGPASAVEYFNASLGHYFLTADIEEIAKLDGGEVHGWLRTGESFRVYSPTAMPPAANPVCRFYGLPTAGIDSHFFSDDVGECGIVKARWPQAWVEETPVAFGAVRSAGSLCLGAYRPVYRVYNNRVDANHRYTTSTAIRDAMLTQGWIEEGRYPNAAGGVAFAMCVPG